jgi:hypothetical protein
VRLEEGADEGGAQRSLSANPPNPVPGTWRVQAGTYPVPAGLSRNPSTSRRFEFNANRTRLVAGTSGSRKVFNWHGKWQNAQAPNFSQHADTAPGRRVPRHVPCRQDQYDRQYGLLPHSGQSDPWLVPSRLPALG